MQAGKLTKEILAQGEDSAFTETPAEMVRRVCRELGNKQNLVVINDEAHHCYRRKPDGQDEELSGEERREAEDSAEEARVWISGLEAVKDKLGLRAIYDLSATPFFLRGSGYSEGTLFPWVVSDFSLIDAIESGLVKVPRVPVEDNAMLGDYPVYRHLWPYVRDELPKKGRKTDAIVGEPKLPAKLQSALHSLYNNYQAYHSQWKGAEAARAVPPPRSARLPRWPRRSPHAGRRPTRAPSGSGSRATGLANKRRVTRAVRSIDRRRRGLPSSSPMSEAVR